MSEVTERAHSQVSPEPRRRLARDVSWLWLGYGGRALAYAGLTVLFARLLDPSGYGRLSVFLAFALGVSYLAGAWPFLTLPILVSSGRGVASVFRPALTVALPLAAVGAIASAAAAHGSVGGWTAGMVLVVYVVALVCLQGLYSVFQAQQRMAGIAAAQTAERVLGLVAVAVLAALGRVTVLVAEATLAVAAATVAVVGLKLVARRTPLLRRSETVGVRVIFSVVGPLALVTAGTYVVAWIDILLLGLFRSYRDVGHYGLAYQAFTVVLQLGSLWMVAALPRYARTAASGALDVQSLLPAAQFRPATRAWAAAVAVAAVVAAEAWTRVFGEEFAASIGPACVLLAGAVPLAAYYAASSVLLAERRTGALAAVTMVGVAVNVGFDLALIPPYGIWGPAVGTALQNAVVTAAVSVMVLGRRRTVDLCVDTLPIAVAVLALSSRPHDTTVAALTLALAAAIGTWSLLAVVRARRVRQ